MESERSGGTNVVYELLHETADERLVETEECISVPDCPGSSLRLMKWGKMQKNLRMGSSLAQGRNNFVAVKDNHYIC